MVRAIASALVVGFSLAPPSLLRHPNGATQSRARYAAETSCVESIRPIPCCLRAIANIYKGLFRLSFLCGAKKSLGGEAEAFREIGAMQPAVAVSLQSHRECAKRSPARTQD